MTDLASMKYGLYFRREQIILLQGTTYTFICANNSDHVIKFSFHSFHHLALHSQLSMPTKKDGRKTVDVLFCCARGAIIG